MWRWMLVLVLAGTLGLVTAGCGEGAADQPADSQGEEEPGS